MKGHFVVMHAKHVTNAIKEAFKNVVKEYSTY